jgi:Zn-dependent oligopeptidase
MSCMWLYWNASDKEIITKGDEIIKHQKKHIEKINTILDIDTFIEQIFDIWTEQTNFRSVCLFITCIKNDEKINKAVWKYEQKLIELSTNQIYIKMLLAKAKDFLSCVSSVTQGKFLESFIKTLRNKGGMLSSDNKKSLGQIEHRIGELERIMTNHDINYHKNDNVKKIISATDYEINSSCKTLQLISLYNFIVKQRIPKKRKEMESIFLNRYHGMIDEIGELIVLRHYKSRLLGYSHYGDFKISDTSLCTAETTKMFLLKILANNKDIYDNSIQKLLEYKSKKDKKPCSTINSWDIDWLMYELMKNYDEFVSNVSLNELLNEILESVGSYFGLVFSEKSHVKTWHKTVCCFIVQRDDEEIGCLYIDLLDRKEKTNCGTFVLQTSGYYPYKTKIKHQGIVAVLAQFRTSKLKLDDVKFLYHQIGLALHLICIKPDASFIGWWQMEKDYIKLPSYVLEQLMWNKKFLCNVGKIDNDTADKIILRSHIGSSIVLRRRILSILYDLILHSKKELVVVILNLRKTLSKSERVEKLTGIFKNIHHELHEQILGEIGMNDILFPKHWSPIGYIMDENNQNILGSEILAKHIFYTYGKSKGEFFLDHFIGNSLCMNNEKLITPFTPLDTTTCCKYPQIHKPKKSEHVHKTKIRTKREKPLEVHAETEFYLTEDTVSLKRYQDVFNVK